MGLGKTTKLNRDRGFYHKIGTNWFGSILVKCRRLPRSCVGANQGDVTSRSGLYSGWNKGWKLIIRMHLKQCAEL